MRRPLSLGICGMTAFLTLAGCGKKGPLIYPDLLVPEPPPFTQAEQFGTVAKVSFNLPAKDLAGRRLKDKELGGVRVSRLVMQSQSAADCKVCPDEFREVKNIDLEFPGPDVVAVGSRLVWTDSDVALGKQYSYRLVGYLKGGTSGTPTSVVSVALREPPQPPTLRIRSAQGALLVAVELPEFFEGDGEIVGVQIYRTLLEPGELEQLVATVSPLKPTYQDLAVRQGARYRYNARTVFKNAGGGTAVGSASAAVEAVVSDAP